MNNEPANESAEADARTEISALRAEMKLLGLRNLSKEKKIRYGHLRLQEMERIEKILDGDTGRRNALTALFEVASKNRWCWNLFCTTCGNGDYRVAFSKIVRGMHPDDPNFFAQGGASAGLLQECREFNDFFGKFGQRSAERSLAKVAKGMRIQEICQVAKLPDWLGFIGLLLNYCQDSEARLCLNAALVPQFKEIVPAGFEVVKGPLIYRLLDGKVHELMHFSDLERIEKVLTPQK